MQVCITVYIKPLAVGNNSWLRAFWRVCKLAVYICYILFLSVRTECRDSSLHLYYSFFFVPPKKNESRKRRPPETPIPLRMPVMAKWAKLATLKQTPILNAMLFILIVRQSRPTSHSRNGAACEQMRAITGKYMPKDSYYLIQYSYMLATFLYE